MTDRNGDADRRPAADTAPTRKPLHNTSKMTPHEVGAWQESTVQDLWRIFRVMSEFVEGFEKMSSVGPCVTVFGSARTKPDHPYYKMGVEVGRQLVRHKFGVITG